MKFSFDAVAHQFNFVTKSSCIMDAKSNDIARVMIHTVASRLIPVTGNFLSSYTIQNNELKLLF